MVPLYGSKGKAENIIELLLNKCIQERRATQKFKRELRDSIGPIITPIMEYILEMEFEDVEMDRRVNRVPSSKNSEWAREFSFQKIEAAFREKAPLSWKLMCALGGVKDTSPQEHDGSDSDNIPLINMEGGVESREDEASETGDTSEEEHGRDPENSRRRRKLRKRRDQNLMVTTAMAVLLNSRNQKVNYFQIIVALAAQGYGVPKRVLTLMNRFGIAVSYATTVRIESITAEANMGEIKQLAARPTGAAYDNLVKEQNVEEETIDNRSSLYKLTVNLVWQLKVPSLVATEGQLLRSLCFKDPDYDNADPLDILGLHNLGEFLRPQIEGLICDTLWKRFGEFMQKNTNLAGRRRIFRPVLHKLESRIDELFVGPTLGIDSGTVTGNIEVLEAIGKMLGMDPKDMVDKVIPIVGDMTTVIMMRHAKEYRKRDIEYNRFQHVDPWAGFLHTLFGKLAPTAGSNPVVGNNGTDIVLYSNS